MPSSYQIQQFRLIPEAIYGTTPAGAFKRILNMMANFGPTYEVETFLPSGNTAPTIGVLNDEFTEADFDGKACFNSLVYPLSSLFGDATITSLGGSPVAYQWDWAWDGRTPLRPVSYTCEYGEPDDSDRAVGFIFNGLGFSGGRGGFDLTAAGFGKKIVEGVDLTGIVKEVQTVTFGTQTGGTFTYSFKGVTTATIAWNASAAAQVSALELLRTIGTGGVTATGGPAPGTPVAFTFHKHLAGVNIPLLTADIALLTGGTPSVTPAETTPGSDSATDVSPVPMFPLQASIFLDTSWATLGTTRLLDIYEMAFDVAERTVRTRPINALLTSDSVVETTGQEHTLALTFAVDAVERARFAKIRVGTKEFSRVEFVGDVVSGANNYRARFDTALLWKEAGKGSDSDSVHTREWTGQIAKDSVSGNAAAIRLVNDRATL